jgi:anti-sigma B factor antagonist
VSLEITQRQTDSLYILVLRGRLALGEESAGFRSSIDNLLAAGATRVVINLEHVDYVDSAGLGALIEARRKIAAKGARLRICNLGPNFRRALEIARLFDLFDHHSTEAAALANF